MIDIEELERLAKAATPGQWEVDDLNNIRIAPKGSPIVATIHDCEDYLPRMADAQYIAVPELIQRIRELEAEVDLLARKIAFHNNKCNCSIECHCGIDVKYLRDWAREKREEREKYQEAKTCRKD